MDLLFDIEANGLLADGDRVWCIVIKDLETGHLESYSPEELKLGLQHLRSGKRLYGHNIVGYDLPFLNEHLGLTLDDSFSVVDTLVISRYLWPERPWGHKLEEWGVHLGNHKIDFHDWSQFSEEMMTYCIQDVELNYLVLKALEEEYGTTFPGYKIYG